MPADDLRHRGARATALCSGRPDRAGDCARRIRRSHRCRCTCSRDHPHGAQVVIDELRLEQQVLRRIAGDRQFGEDDQLRRLRFGARGEVENLSALPAMSPTVGLIWASAIRMGEL